MTPDVAFARFVASGRFWAEDASWEDLEVASRHGLVGPWAARTNEGRAVLMTLKVRFARLLSLAHECVETLEKAKVPVVVLKGPTSAAAWRVPSHRAQSDIDLLVTKASAVAAVAALVDAGLVKAPASLETRHFHITLASPRFPTVPIELHTLLSDDFFVQVDTEALLRAQRKVEVDGRSLPALAVEHQLTHLALHAAMHGGMRLAWFFDLVELSRAAPPWDDVVRVAKEWGAAWPVWWSLREARRLGATVPGTVERALRPPWPVWARVEAAGRLPIAASDSAAARALRLAFLPLKTWPRYLLDRASGH